MSGRKLGLWGGTSLVLGNMVGSGIFMLPAALAIYGGYSLLGWGIAALGALLMAHTFRGLAQRVPNAQGGPYAFTREGLGEFPAFLVAWGYWISIWCTNAAIAVAFVSYLSVFLPALDGNFLLSAGTGMLAIWLLTWLNTRPIGVSGRLQLATTVLKLLPLLLIAVAGLFYLDWTHFRLGAPLAFSEWGEMVTLCLFAFLGMESATIPADGIENPQRTIPLATALGTGMAIGVYVLGSVSVMGLLGPEALQASNAPFADAAEAIWGVEARYWVAAGALVSTFGALNGWILLQGQLPAAAAADGLFPAFFGRRNRFGMPWLSLAASSLLASALMSLNFSKGFAETFKFAMLLSTLTSLLPYLFSAASYLLLPGTNKWAGAGTFAFLFWAISGSGTETVYWGFLLLLSGIPFYIWMKQAAGRNRNAP
jgi:APA family basic amino acid/polyamine antiporter